MAHAYGRVSGDPRHPDNANDPDWQGGFLYGKFTSKNAMDDIADEYRRRGSPEYIQADSTQPERERFQKFRNWKAGYWAGRQSQD